MGLVERKQLVDVQVRHAVAIGQHEGLVPDIVTHPLDAATCHGVQARVHHRDLPGLGGVVVDRHIAAAIGEVVCNVRGVQEVVREVLLDDMLLVARADDELVEAVVAVQLHDVPQDGHPAQLHHGLGFELAFFTDAGAVAPR